MLFRCAAGFQGDRCEDVQEASSNANRADEEQAVVGGENMFRASFGLHITLDYYCTMYICSCCVLKELHTVRTLYTAVASSVLPSHPHTCTHPSTPLLTPSHPHALPHPHPPPHNCTHLSTPPLTHFLTSTCTPSPTPTSSHCTPTPHQV